MGPEAGDRVTYLNQARSVLKITLPTVFNTFTLMFSSPLRTPLVALITYVAIGSITPAVSAAPNAVVKPSTSNSNVDVDGLKNPNLKVTTTISNTGGETLKLLNDHRGVLDPFPEDSFTITDPSGSRLSSRGERVNHTSGYVINQHANALGLRL